MAIDGLGMTRGSLTADMLGERVEVLQKALGEHVKFDDMGRAHVPRGVARELYVDRERRRADHVARQKVRRADRASKGDPVDKIRARLSTRRAQQPNSGNALADLFAEGE